VHELPHEDPGVRRRGTEFLSPAAVQFHRDRHHRLAEIESSLSIEVVRERLFAYMPEDLGDDFPWLAGDPGDVDRAAAAKPGLRRTHRVLADHAGTDLIEFVLCAATDDRLLAAIEDDRWDWPALLVTEGERAAGGDGRRQRVRGAEI
jgi:hypothetical protein